MNRKYTTFTTKCALCGEEITAKVTIPADATTLKIQATEKVWKAQNHICKACAKKVSTSTEAVNIITDKVMCIIDSLNHATGTRFEIEEKVNNYVYELQQLLTGTIALHEDKEYVIFRVGDLHSISDDLVLTAHEADKDKPWTSNNTCTYIGSGWSTSWNELTECMYININDLEFTDEKFSERWEKIIAERGKA